MVLLQKKEWSYRPFHMQTQLDSANNMGWVTSGHTSLCVRLKCQIHVFKAETFVTTAVQKWAENLHVGQVFLPAFNKVSAIIGKGFPFHLHKRLLCLSVCLYVCTFILAKPVGGFL